jgi:hypothetical protein
MKLRQKIIGIRAIGANGDKGGADGDPWAIHPMEQMVHPIAIGHHWGHIMVRIAKED